MAFSIAVNVAGAKAAGIRKPDVSKTGVYSGEIEDADRLTSGKGNDVSLFAVKITEDCDDKGISQGVVLSNDFDKKGTAAYWRALLETVIPASKHAILEKEMKIESKNLTGKKVYLYASVPPAGETSEDGKVPRTNVNFITLAEYEKYKKQHGSVKNGAGAAGAGAGAGKKGAAAKDETKEEEKPGTEGTGEGAKTEENPFEE